MTTSQGLFLHLRVELKISVRLQHIAMQIIDSIIIERRNQYKIIVLQNK